MEHYISLNTIHQWSGGSIEWLVMEFMVYCLYVFTLFILILKSRFCKIGIDQSYQFEPTYLAYMANKIIDNLNIKESLLSLELNIEELKLEYC